MVPSGQSPRIENTARAPRIGGFPIDAQTLAGSAAPSTSVTVGIIILLLLVVLILWGMARGMAMMDCSIITLVRRNAPSGSDSPAQSRTERKGKRRNDSMMPDCEMQDLHHVRSHHNPDKRRHSDETGMRSATATGLSIATEWPQTWRRNTVPLSAFDTPTASGSPSTAGSSASRRLRPSGAVQTEEEWIRRRQRFEESGADEENLLPHAHSDRGRGARAVERLSKVFGSSITRTLGSGNPSEEARGMSTRTSQGYKRWNQGFLETIDGLVDKLAAQFVHYTRDGGREQDLIVAIAQRERDADFDRLDSVDA